MRWQRLLLVAGALPALGCYTTWDIAPRNVNTLRMYDPPTVAMAASDGDLVEIDRDTELVFRAFGSKAEELDVKFESLAVHGGPADHAWWLSGILRGDGRSIRVDMNQVAFLTAKRFSPAKTGGLIAGIVLGAGLTAVSVLAIIISSAEHNPGGDTGPKRANP